MKKITLLFAFGFAGLVASAQCVIDQNNQEVIAPAAEDLPCAERGEAYSEVLQISIPASVSTQFGNADIDSLVITGLSGLPTGITWDINPTNGVIPGGTNACGLLSGTTNDPAQRYPITINGSAYVKVSGFPTTLALDQSPASDLFNLYIDVIEAGSGCRTTVSIFEKSNGLSISMYPNPNNGVFTLSVKSDKAGDIELAAFDVTGRKVFTEKSVVSGNFNTTVNLSHLPKGIYAVQVRSAEGVISKNVMVH